MPTPDALFDVDMDTEPGVFQGDYFGADYTWDELGIHRDETHSVNGQENVEWDLPDPAQGYDSEEERDSDDGVVNAPFEGGWEPKRLVQNGQTKDTPAFPPVNSSPASSVPNGTAPVEQGHHYLLESADARYARRLGEKHSLYHPFTSKRDWEIARWAKLRGPSTTAFTELLKIEGVVDALGLSYKSGQELNTIIDHQLPGRPPFTCHEVVVAGEVFEFYCCDIIQKTLYGLNEASAAIPQHAYWEVVVGDTKDLGFIQREVEKAMPGATIIPIIISTDKTQLTIFGNKTVYPMYMTIGNIPKEIRRKPSRGAYILLAYLPTSSLKHIQSKVARSRARESLSRMVVVDGKGIARCGHPIFAVYVADYPEQGLATNAKYGRCPGLCPTERDKMGDDDTDYPFLDLNSALRVLETLEQGPTAFHQACKEAGMKPITEPFWKGLPYTNIYHSITPDILHQLYQGLVKHLVSWLIKVFGAAEIDARCC
ncbi:hypothetical protein VNI00_015955 [Paramarasmius palmivorus]|uniref:Uncharacterized protein n=1 Tax=Paramarasmius palmivorus TaxID=297713 RepID=A0AAW0BGJ6_9AGAR